MIYDARVAEEETVLMVAEKMCVAARTAPKTKGQDFITACVITGEEKDALASEMERLSEVYHYGFFCRDAQNIRDSLAVVLLGVENETRGLGDGCGYCGFNNCQQCENHGGMCAYGPIDLGIAVGAAVSIAADNRVDNRVMFSAGRAAMAMGIFGESVREILAIPLSVSGKSPYFDRKPK